MNKVKALIDIVAGLAVLAISVYVVHVARAEQRPTSQPRASCAQLYQLARSSTDSLYVVIARGDCAR